MAVAHNQEYYNAYSQYLKTHNITEAQQDGFVFGDKVIPVNYDMFFDYILNKIVLTVIGQNTFTDPLSFLYKEDLNVGGIIEDIRTILQGEDEDYASLDFEASISNPFAKTKTKNSIVYHKITDRKKFKVTTSFEQIKESFAKDGGINSLVNSIVNDLSVQYNAWSYNEKKKVLESESYVQKVFFDGYEDFALKFADVEVDLKYFDNSHKYNASVLYSPVSFENYIIVMSSKYKREIDIKYFTGLFNVSYADLMKNVIYIDSFKDENVVCGVYDKRGIQFRKTLDTMKQLENPEDLTRNHYMHTWRMHSVSPHYNAVLFTKKTATTPQVSKTNDVFTDEFNLTITAGSGTTIKYSVDKPFENGVTGTTYSSPIKISNSCTIYIKVSKNGEDDTLVAYRYRKI